MAYLHAELNVQNSVTGLLLAKQTGGTLCLFNIFKSWACPFLILCFQKSMGRYGFDATPVSINGTVAKARTFFSYAFLKMPYRKFLSTGWQASLGCQPSLLAWICFLYLYFTRSLGKHIFSAHSMKFV